MKRLFFLALIFGNLTVFGQTDPTKPVNFEYMPRINEVAVKGNVTQKYTAYKNGNPVYFVVVKKMNINVWDVEMYNKLTVGAKVDLVGIVPLSWQPDKNSPVPNRIQQNVVATQ